MAKFIHLLGILVFVIAIMTHNPPLGSPFDPEATLRARLPRICYPPTSTSVYIDSIALRINVTALSLVPTIARR